MQIDTFILQGPPKPLDHSMINPAAFTVHTDLYLCGTQNAYPVTTDELAALVGIEYLRRTMRGQHLLQGLDAEVCIHAVRQPPRQNLTTVPVHNCHEVQKAALHRNIRDVRASDLICAVNRGVGAGGHLWGGLVC